MVPVGQDLAKLASRLMADAMTLGPDGDLYIASGDTAEDSAILRF